MRCEWRQIPFKSSTWQENILIVRTVFIIVLILIDLNHFTGVFSCLKLNYGRLLDMQCYIPNNKQQQNIEYVYNVIRMKWN